MKKKTVFTTFLVLLFALTLVWNGCKNDEGTDPGDITITVAPKEVSVAPGGAQLFTATVITTGSASNKIKWEIISTGHSAGTVLHSAGHNAALQVANNEPASSSIVIKVSPEASAFSDKAELVTVTITGTSSADPTVTGVSIAPASVTLS